MTSSTSNSPIRTTTSWRPEIQGLRALAALLVATYHIWFDRVSGAIDVFFVVSGYLITRRIVQNLDSDGSIHFRAHLARICRRIMPAAYFVLLGIIVASALWLSPVAWKGTLEDIRSAALYVANWDFAFGAVDYFAAESNQNPALHYWALSMQGQFYVVWPLLLGGTAVVARRLGRDLRRSVLVFMAVAAVLSMALAIRGVATNQAFTYYNTFARLWEFSLGGIVAVGFAAWQMPSRIARVAGWVGLVMIIGNGAVIDGSVSYPGLLTLSPTLAASLILLAGTASQRTGAVSILSSAPAVWLGNISYSLFLWHWPVLVFVHLRIGAGALTILEGSAVLAVSVVLAVLTTKFVETPFRRSLQPLATGRWAWAYALIPLTMVVGLTWTVRPQAIADELDLATHPGPGVFAADWQGDLPEAPLVPALEGARTDFPADGGRACFQRAQDPTVLRCVFGHSDPRATIVMVGGSHTRQWLSAMERIAADHRIRLVTFLKATCRFQIPDRSESCTRWNEAVVAQVIAEAPDAVFTTGTVVARNAEEQTPEGFLTQWGRLGQAGIPVLAIRDNPRFPFDPPACVAVKGAEACSLSRGSVLAPTNPALLVVDLPPSVHPIDLTPWLCDDQICPVVAGNVLMYRDDHHLTATYSRALAPYLEAELRRVAPWLLTGP